VKQGYAQLTDNNVPYKRPDDYFAEMLKSDTHMFKVFSVVQLMMSYDKGEAKAGSGKGEARTFGKCEEAAKPQENWKAGTKHKLSHRFAATV
jgi:rRNA-processing protein EBP2